MTSTAREENAYTLGVQAGLWGYPLAHRVEAFPRTLEVKGIGHNSFRKFYNLKTAHDRFVVTPNNLTIDGYAILDLADGPVVIHVPNLDDDRWFIVQIGDAFDDVVLIGGSRPHVPGAYLVTGPEYQGPVPGHDAGRVSHQHRVRRVAHRRARGQRPFRRAASPGRLHDQTAARLPARRYRGSAGRLLAHRLSRAQRPGDLVHFDRLGSAMKYMLPTHADVNDTFVQTLGTIGLSVRNGFDWHSLDEPTLAGLRRAVPVIEQIADERWSTMSDTVSGWRGSLASGRCSYDWALNAANTKNQVGTKVADQVVYLNTAVDSDGQPLDGANAYVLHFEPGQTPPVAGMWNIARYDDSMLFTANEFDRFSIGSTTDGLTRIQTGP